MTDQQIEPREVQGRVLCDEQAASCRCVKVIGHVEAGDEVHSCDPRECTGKWSGDLDGSDFVVVHFPMAVGA